MFKLGKRAISQYIRSECDRRLWLDLYPSDKASREAVKAPTKDAGRPGLRLLTEQGLRFEAEKFRELKEVFKGNVRHGDARPRSDSKDSNFAAIDLKTSTGWLQPGIFLLEAEYEVTKPFISANGLDALPFDVFARVRPDILHVVKADGSRRREIKLDGTIRDLDPADSRVGLRIIDVKFAADPSPAHFVELAYYGMTLAGWLVQNRLLDQYVVLSDAAIWSGKHEASQLYKVAADARRMGRDPADHELNAAFENDLVSLEPDVVVGRLKRFLRHDLPRVVGAGDWKDLPWHIAQSCSGCDYLGYGWSKTDEGEDGLPTTEAEDDKKKDWSRHCWSEAARKDSANRVFGLTKGAMGKLRIAGVADLQGLAALQATNRAFEGHQTLRANRTLFPARASKLLDRSAGAIPDRAGTSGTMPGWSDIKVFLHTDFDIGSGLTFDFAYMIDGSKPSVWNADRGSLERSPLREGPQRPKFYSVKNNKILMELEMFRQFLTDLAHDLSDAAAAIDQGYRAHDKKNRITPTKATVQFYFWDNLAFEHLRRLCGRHLNEIRSLKIGNDDIEPLLWLVPAEQLLQDEMFIKAGSPVTILSEAIRNLVAADIPHHYGLLPLANTYRMSFGVQL